MTLRVLIVGDEIPMPGGSAASHFVGRMARGLAHAGASAHVLCLDYTESAAAPRNTEARGPLGDGATFEYAVASPVKPAGAALLAGRVRARLGLRALVAARATPGSTVVVHYGRFSSVLLHLLAICRAEGIPLVHCLVEWRLAFAHQTLRQRIDDAVFHRSLRRLDGSIVVSTYLETALRSQMGVTHPILRVPVFSDREIVAVPSPSPPARPYALLCADFDSYPHDACFAVDAVARVPELELLLVGKAEARREEILARARSQGCEARVTLRSTYVPDDELRTLYAGAAALLAPLGDDDRSRARFPSKVADYLLAGAPVVSNRVGEVDAWLRDGETAFLAPPGDVEAFAEAIRRAVTDPSRARVAAQGRALASEVFDFRVQGERLRAFLEGIAAARQAPARSKNM